jgi:hypothetical protein
MLWIEGLHEKIVIGKEIEAVSPFFREIGEMLRVLEKNRKKYWSILFSSYFFRKKRFVFLNRVELLSVYF